MQGEQRVFPAPVVAEPRGMLIGGCDGSLYAADPFSRELWRVSTSGVYEMLDVPTRSGFSLVLRVARSGSSKHKPRMSRTSERSNRSRAASSFTTATYDDGVSVLRFADRRFANAKEPIFKPILRFSR